MLEGFRRPETLMFKGNTAKKRHVFKQKYDSFIAAAHSDKDARTTSFILLNLASSEAIERERAFLYTWRTQTSDQSRIKKRRAMSQTQIPQTV